MDIRLLDALLERSRDGAGGLRLTGEGSMLGELVKAVLERALDAELTAQLGYERRERAGYNSGNSRNDTIAKKVQTGIGPVGLAVPRDRAGSFEPVLIPKRSRPQEAARCTHFPQGTPGGWFSIESRSGSGMGGLKPGGQALGCAER
jgi:hypothetical protein